MDGVRKKVIRDKVEELTKESEQYQLIHATYAARTMIKSLVMKYYKARYEELLERISNKIEAGNNIESELQEKAELESRTKQRSFHIDVEYIETRTDDMARVIKIENSFVINLPRSLADRIFKENGEYDYDVIHKIRELMAHELGHLILHTDELLYIEGTQGSKELTDEDYEDEARYFANELIECRRERNKKFYEDKAYKNF